MTREKIYWAINAERGRQDRLFGNQSIAGILPLDTKFRILGEEVGEVARAIDRLQMARSSNKMRAMTKKRRRELQEELVQVAACAVGMLESL